MSSNSNVYYKNSKVNMILGTNAIPRINVENSNTYKLCDKIIYLNKYWKYNIDNNSEIVYNLSSATRDNVFLTTDKKWYVKNNLNNYEEYGIIELVDSLDECTYYNGKLVELSTDEHEYKWNGSAWVDLGPKKLELAGFIGCMNIKIPYNGSYFVLNRFYDVDITYKVIETGSWNLLITSSRGDYLEYELFWISSTSTMYYDLGNNYGYRLSCSYNPTLNVWHNVMATNGNYLRTTRSLYLDGNNCGMTTTLGLESNTNNVILTGHKNLSFKNFKIYGSSGLVFDLVPVLLEDGSFTMYDKEHKIYAERTDTNTITGDYEYVYPEKYEEKDEPTEILKKSSYTEMLYGNYINGQKVQVYDTLLPVIDGKILVEQKMAMFDGLSYFNTGVMAKNNIKMEIEFSYDTLYSTGDFVVGSRYTYNQNAFNFCVLPDKKLRVDLGNIITTTSVEILPNTFYKIILYVYSSGSNTNCKIAYKVTENDKVLTNQTLLSVTGVNRTSSGNGANICIGNTYLLVDGVLTPFPNEFIGNIKYVNLYENINQNGEGVLTHRYVFRNVNGVGKMFDVMTNEYFENLGTGHITVIDQN